MRNGQTRTSHDPHTRRLVFRSARTSSPRCLCGSRSGAGARAGISQRTTAIQSRPSTPSRPPRRYRKFQTILPTPSNFLSIVVDHPLSDAMINVRHGPVRSYSCSRSCYCSPSLSSCCPLQRRSAVISALVQTSRFGGNAHATPYRPLRRRNPVRKQEKETKGSSVISLAGGTSCEP